MYKEVYLDNSATTRPFDQVIELMNQINRNTFGNPSSLHRKGIEAERLIRKARESTASAMNVESKEIYFTSGGTEANNLAIRGYLEANPRKGRHIITTKIEHPAVLEVCKYLENTGFRVDYIGVDERGIINICELESKLSKETALISIMHTNNEVGSIQPIEEVARIRNSVNKDAVIHVDAVQAFGKVKLLPKKLGIDMMTVSSHKIHGPKGVGALYVNKALRLKPIVFGGGQESLLRSGTENVPGICGFGLAVETALSDMDKNFTKVSELKSLFIEKLKDNVENYRIVSPEGSSPYILNVSFGNLRSEVLLHHLEEKNIFVSTGSACSSRKNVHSHVLKAMEFEARQIEGSIRFSFSHMNSEGDILDTIEALKAIIPKIQINRGGRR